ncbi:MAG: SsrA-binding protein SmpB [Armatimonadetes bacterium]|nr:SsrA-binding protein SmpB [Armatimonadota bacterium]
MSKDKKKPVGQTEAGGRRVIIRNRRAFHEYEILERLEAGLVLTGTEIKSIRAGQVQLQDAFGKISNGEIWVQNMHVAPYEHGNRFNTLAMRDRKLLLHRQEIDRLVGRVQEKGLALIPLSIYLRNGFAKLELGLARGKKLYDKREAIAEREARRDQERALAGRDGG